jgi:DNA-binding PadR family transcriptional regulator
MDHKGWIKSEWATTENNRRAKFYELTALGRKQLQAQTSAWNNYVDAVKRLIVEPAPREARVRG